MSSQGVYWEISKQISGHCLHTPNLPTTPAEDTPTLHTKFETLHSTMQSLCYANSGSSLGKFNSYLPIEAKLNDHKAGGGTEKMCLEWDLEKGYKKGKRSKCFYFCWFCTLESANVMLLLLLCSPPSPYLLFLSSFSFILCRMRLQTVGRTCLLCVSNASHRGTLCPSSWACHVEGGIR